VIAVLENSAFLEAVIKHFVATSVVAINGKDKFGVAIIVIISCINEPQAIVKVTDSEVGVDHEPAIVNLEASLRILAIDGVSQMKSRHGPTGRRSIRLNYPDVLVAVKKLSESGVVLRKLAELSKVTPKLLTKSINLLG
jgi:hypothetical protein